MGFRLQVRASAGSTGLSPWLPPVTHFANLAMVSILGLFLKAFPLLQHLWVREGNPIDPLQSFHVRAALPVRRRVLRKRSEEIPTEDYFIKYISEDSINWLKHLFYLIDFHGLDLACVSDMGTSAQVNQGPTPNHRIYTSDSSFTRGSCQGENTPLAEKTTKSKLPVSYQQLTCTPWWWGWWLSRSICGI